MYNLHSFGLEWLRKKCFPFFSKMAENNRKSWKFFSKCGAASRGRIELDVEELRLSLLWGLLIIYRKMIECS